MKLLGSGGQQRRDSLFDASGTITTGGTAQLLLPQSKARSYLLIVNNSSGLLMVQIGILPAVATISGGKVASSITVNDVGFGFNLPPIVEFLGGGNSNDPPSYGATAPDWPAPAAPASGIAIMAASAINGLKISSITLNNPGSGYLAAPYVQVRADRTDPTGVGLPSATAGIPLLSQGSNYYSNGTTCPTDAVAIWGATTGQAFTCKWMT